METDSASQTETVNASEIQTNSMETNMETTENSTIENPADSESMDSQTGTEITPEENESGSINAADQTESSSESDTAAKAENLIDKFINWIKGLFQ